jgi:hypothetical protein
MIILNFWKKSNQLWNEFIKWFNRVFRGRYSSVKPSNSVNLMNKNIIGVEPIFNSEYKRRIELKK